MTSIPISFLPRTPRFAGFFARHGPQSTPEAAGLWSGGSDAEKGFLLLGMDHGPRQKPPDCGPVGAMHEGFFFCSAWTTVHARSRRTARLNVRPRASRRGLWSGGSDAQKRPHQRRGLGNGSICYSKKERKTRFELATLSLARRCSTAEPLPPVVVPKPRIELGTP